MKAAERRCSSVFILKFKQFSRLSLSLANFEQVIVCLEFSSNFAITKICNAIRLGDDGRRTSGL